MIADTIPICRVCARRGKAVEAAWVLDDGAVTNYYLCRSHAEVIGRALVGHYKVLRPLEKQE